MKGFWHEWRGSNDGRPSMLVRHLFSVGDYKLDLHKFIRADDPTCFHTHPAKAIRVILWGGYCEEVRHPDYVGIIDGRKWFQTLTRPVGFVGIVRPELCHRIDSLLNGKSSYSLWLRWPKTAQIEIFGEC